MMAPWRTKQKEGKNNTDPDSQVAVVVSSQSTLPTNNYSYGIKIWTKPTEEYNVDIVFVHGLTGNREKTWSAHDFLWPEQLLSKKFPQARIMGFGYDADIVNFWSQAGMNKIGQHAESLVATLADERTDSEDIPIIFVAHSLGGIVTIDALATSKKSSEEHLQKVWENTRGIIFMGSPLRGASLADWAAIGANFIRLFKRVNQSLLSTLQRDSEVLERIRKDFMMQLKARYDAREKEKSLKLKCFTEEIPVSGVGLIVPADSATIEGWQTSRSIHANHMDMTKFASDEDPGYKAVSAEIFRWIRDLNKPFTPPAMPAETTASTDKATAESVAKNEEPAAMMTTIYQGGNIFGSTNSTNSGRIIQGNYSGRDITFN